MTRSPNSQFDIDDDRTSTADRGLPAMDGPSAKFSKADRILARDLFRRVYEGGRKIQSKYFTAFVLANEAGRPRLGITATRKIGSSVERNRARRLVREAFRRNKWLAPNGVDIVINVRRSLVGADYRDLENEFRSFLERAGKK